MKNLFACAAMVVVSFHALSQKEIKPTSSFIISGEVKSPLTVGISDLKKWSATNIGDVIITNHLGEKRSEAKGLKGILLKNILSSVEITAESPKILSEYYFVCKASDDYIVVFSWNELFNNPAGDAVYIITEKAGKAASEMEESILLMSPKDLKTGRRNVKSLFSIEVKRAR